MLPEKFRTQGYGHIQHIYDTYRAQGTAAARDIFTSGLSERDDGSVMCACMDGTQGDEIRVNSMFWFEFELRQYTSAPVNMELLQKEKEKFIPLARVESGDGPGVGPITVIANVLGNEVMRIPRGHVRFMTIPEVFAEGLLKLLK
ncbi:hypothetical protein BDZ45DRAFT_805459 [Acephala macrosclerotiorum]|nr:hypothetical protein BDZ45DRAFT_805459 [Acephala macrosclerotiorum]